MAPVRSSWSVMPPKADTTTMAGSWADSTMRFTVRMLSTEPTEVPPNFITFMQMSWFCVLSRRRRHGVV